MKNIIFICLFISLKSFGQTIIPKDFKKSVIKIDKVQFDIYKGTIPVKINHSDSSSGYLTLPVHIIKSPSQSPAEPIYWLNGGPGNSNMWQTPPKELLANHDFVLIGYRGIDGSITMNSKKVGKAMKGLHNHLFSNESLDNLGIQMKQYSDALVKEGIDINHFTIIDVIEDFEEVRKQLGHQKINLCSTSYGTRVALLYSYRYPEIIKRSFMLCVSPPGHLLWNPKMTTRIIQMYDSIYKTQFGKCEITIEESIRQSFERMPKRWSFFKLDADKIKTASFHLLYMKNYAVMVFDSYKRAALKNDYSGLYLMQLYYDYSMPKAFTYGDFFSKAVSADYNKNIDYRKLFRPDSLEIGAPFSLLVWGAGNNWPIKLINPEYRKPQLNNTETLMVGGNLDISTPPEFATKELLPHMPNGKQVILSDMAHVGDITWSQYDAFSLMITRYLDEGKVDTSKFKHDPVNFKTKKGFNKMAKRFYPIVFVLSLFK